MHMGERKATRRENGNQKPGRRNEIMGASSKGLIWAKRENGGENRGKIM